MTNQEMLCDLYRGMLNFAGLRTDKDGFVSYSVDNDWKPFAIKGMRVVVPTEIQIRQVDWSQRMAFHPLLENTSITESAVLTRYRKLAFAHLNAITAATISCLLTIAASEADHAKLTPSQADFLTLVKGADEKSIQNLHAVMEKVPEQQAGRYFFHVFLTRKAVIAGQAYGRVARVEFPLYQDLVELPSKTEKGKPLKINGVAIRSKDREIWMAIYEYVFPELKTKEGVAAFTCGSNSRLSPSTDALMHSLGRVGTALNDTILAFKKFFPPEVLNPLGLEGVEGLSLEWLQSGKFDAIDDWANMIRSVTSMTGNDVSEDSLEATLAARQEASKTVQARPVEPSAPTTSRRQEPEEPRRESWRRPAPESDSLAVHDDRGALDVIATARRINDARDRASRRPWERDRGYDRDYDRDYDRGGRGRYGRDRDRDYDRPRYPDRGYDRDYDYDGRRDDRRSTGSRYWLS